MTSTRRSLQALVLAGPRGYLSSPRSKELAKTVEVSSSSVPMNCAASLKLSANPNIF
eukprot:CAMPEP_0180422462 /NCGR_PEP_ID=MMETSP1036_2-20121128/3689_1 /TAXON_ID=632150 /ORGANISM="Azadinium spinosum, Strain 3D9" /LENGTH=56 /DNA_ID=CAMNT_0022427779 /DNA_START=252 /DNA_END=419 /DNA_ORIENTATION=+